MFLNKLTDDEKKAFIKLAYYLAKIDKRFSKEEKDIVSSFLREMNMEDPGFNEEEFDLYDVLSNFKRKISKNIVVVELFSLALIDDYMSIEENELLKKVINYFEIDPKLLILLYNFSKAYVSLYIQGETLITL
ncbi:hypothetical protein [Hippea sp. KM1]|uniref:hypothetical protein n=1 Tax=Hippea sp. KM1 TaxID=944481 RepID=UPI00046D45CA|nr:hypothetical protein [Hippea sp. KM1]